MGGLAHFVKIAEHPVVAQLELGDAGVALFFFKHCLKFLLAMFHQIHEAVQIRMVAGFEQAAVGDDRGRAVHQRPAEQGGAILQTVPARAYFVQGGGQIVAEALLLGGICPVGGRGQGRMDARQGGKAVAQGDEIARRGPFQRDAGGQALDVVDGVQGLAQAFAADVVRMQKGHRVLNAANGAAFPPGVAQHVLQQTTAHGRHGLIQHMAQRPLALAAVETHENFKIALGHVVHEHAPSQIQRLEGQQMFGQALLRLFQIMQQRAAGPHEFGLVVQAKGLRFLHALRRQHAPCGPRKVKGRARLAHKANALQQAMRRQGHVLGQEQFARGELLRPLPQLAGPANLHARPLARGNVGPGEGPLAAVRIEQERAEVVVALAVQIGVIQHRGRGDHPGDGPLHKPLGLSRILHLIADGHMVALVHELGQIGLRRMPGHAAHGHGVLAVLAAAGQGDLQFARRGDGVIEEEFVKVAHAVEEQGIGMLGLDAQVLLEHGRELAAGNGGRGGGSGPVGLCGRRQGWRFGGHQRQAPGRRKTMQKTRKGDTISR